MKLSNSILGPVIAAVTACGGPEPKPFDHDYTEPVPAVTEPYTEEQLRSDIEGFKPHCLEGLRIGVNAFKRLATRAREIQANPHAEMTLVDWAQVAIARNVTQTYCIGPVADEPEVRAIMLELKAAADIAKPELAKAAELVKERRAQTETEELKRPKQ